VGSCLRANRGGECVPLAIDEGSNVRSLGTGLLCRDTRRKALGVAWPPWGAHDLALRDYEGILEWINTHRPNPDGGLYIKDNRLILPGDEGPG